VCFRKSGLVIDQGVSGVHAKIGRVSVGDGKTDEDDIHKKESNSQAMLFSRGKLLLRQVRMGLAV